VNTLQETLAQMSTQVTEKWNGFSKRQKISLGVGVGVFVLAIIIASIALSRPKMQPIFSGMLALEDASQVIEVLDEQRISYTLENEGRTIKVNEKDLSNVKILLARENVPQSGYKFSDYINNSMATTQDERKAKLVELNKTRLEEQLASINGVREARVNLVIPEEKNSFLASKQASSASVVLTLSQSLDSARVESIARFVAGSIENLDLENITIIDSNGNTLYAAGEDVGLNATKQQEYKLSAEKNVRDNLNQILQPLFDEVRISPTLILDFDYYEEAREEYLPQFEDNPRGIVDREVVSSASSTNTTEGAEPGVANNGGEIPVYQVGGAGNGESKESYKEIDYVTNRVVSNSVKNLGNIDYARSSVAVHVFKDRVYRQEMVENTLPQGMSWEQFKEDNINPVPLVLEEGLMQSIQMGSGVQNVAVYGYERPIFIDATPYVINWTDYLPYILILLILVLVVVAILRFRNQNEIVETEPELEVEEMIQTAKEEVQLEEIELKETLETKRQIDKFVDEKPEAVANLLRNWLSEEDWE
jgi:flagellar M-ring protein FliF